MLAGLQEKEEKLDGDAAVNKLFRDIYQSADEDMRRAMSKSFVSLLQMFYSDSVCICASDAFLLFVAGPSGPQIL